MANLPEKNITTVSAITSIPSNTNVYVNANGQFGQASIDNVVKASNVVSDATLGAMKEFIDSQFKVLTGSPILAQGTEDGYMPSFKGKGASSQKSYNGYQLFDASKLPTATVGGATVTNNRDGSFTISGSGNLTSIFSRQYSYSADEAVKLLKVGQCTLKSEAVTMPYISFVLYDTESNSVFKQLDNSNSTKSSIDITEEIMTKISNGKYNVKLFIYGSSGLAIKTGTIKPMLYQDGDGTWEPFVGAQPSPNPSYTQPIKSKGDCGWFDGELLQGDYSATTGGFVSSTNHICSKNVIPCKADDEIIFTYEDDSITKLYIVYYDVNKNYLRYVGSATNIITEKVPADACYFHISIHKTNISVSTAKKIVVTINGTYAVKVKSVGRNFFGGLEFANALVASGATINATYSTNGIIGLQSSPATGNAIFYDNFKENTQYTIFLKGINTIADNEDVTNMAIIYTDGSSKSISFNTDKSLSFYTSTAGKTIKHIKGSYNTGIAKFEYDYFGIMEGVCTLEDFEPYKEHNEWIPLSEPLRGIGEVTDIIKATDGVYRGHRKIKKLVLNGSEGFAKTEANEKSYFNLIIGNYGSIVDNVCLSTHFIKKYVTSATSNIGLNVLNSTAHKSAMLYIRPENVADMTLDEFNTWLAENPITVQYELAEEEIEELDQSPFYRLKTFEGATHISATDDMEMVVEVPTSRAGGVASIGWSKGNLAQIETRNLSAKIAELQTAIVNS